MNQGCQPLTRTIGQSIGQWKPRWIDLRVNMLSRLTELDGFSLLVRILRYIMKGLALIAAII